MAGKIGSVRKRKIIAALMARDGGAWCYWCGEATEPGHFRTTFYDPRMMTIDHLIPRSRGGSNAQDNLVIACRECNEARGNMSYIPPEYRRQEAVV